MHAKVHGFLLAHRATCASDGLVGTVRQLGKTIHMNLGVKSEATAQHHDEQGTGNQHFPTVKAMGRHSFFALKIFVIGGNAQG
tara:strand:- start:288 stop:536 length:249 start_codon:yes stop_codon:yes gene_type:complete